MTTELQTTARAAKYAQQRVQQFERLAFDAETRLRYQLRQIGVYQQQAGGLQQELSTARADYQAALAAYIEALGPDGVPGEAGEDGPLV
jgi:hypothetical protein